MRLTLIDGVQRLKQCVLRQRIVNISDRCVHIYLICIINSVLMLFFALEFKRLMSARVNEHCYYFTSVDFSQGMIRTVRILINNVEVKVKKMWDGIKVLKCCRCKMCICSPVYRPMLCSMQVVRIIM